jgi:5-methyltetrahydrofolate--homocysteine methyltransferase
MENSKNFLGRLQAGEVLVSDGATGTNLQKRGLGPGVPTESWVLEKPDEIVALEQAFVEAGSDVILTCTFGASPLHLIHTGMGDYVKDVNTQAVKLARKAVQGTQTLVAGSIGPTGQLIKPYGPMSEEEAVQTFAEQAQLLTRAETQFDLGEAKAAVQGVRSVSSLPLVVSFSYDRGTRTMMGVKPARMAAELQAMEVDVLGINCGNSLEDNLKALIELRAATTLPIWFKPNAGLPVVDEDGNPSYTISPEQMGEAVSEWIKAGAQIVGGCCGTSPEHLRAIARAAKK